MLHEGPVLPTPKVSFIPARRNAPGGHMHWNGSAESAIHPTFESRPLRCLSNFLGLEARRWPAATRKLRTTPGFALGWYEPGLWLGSLSEGVGFAGLPAFHVVQRITGRLVFRPTDKGRSPARVGRR